MDQQDNWWLLLFFLFLNDSNKEELKKLGINPISNQLEEKKDLLKRFYPEPMNPFELINRETAIGFATFDPEKEAQEREIRSECEQIEWVQDMGAHVPFCKLDGQFCNMQCIRRHNEKNCAVSSNLCSYCLYICRV